MSSADLTVLRYVQETTIGVQPVGAKASGTLTASALADGETVTIDGKVYTLEASLTNVNGHVKVGANLTATLLNLKNAIHGSGGASGVDYAASTTAHTTVDDVSSSATTLVVRAKAAGTAGNALATTDTSGTASWGATTLLGGLAGPALKQLRYTGESLNFNIENTKTAEIRPDRTETDLIQTGASAAGDINFELSYGTFDDLIAAALCGNWVLDGGGLFSTLENGTELDSFVFQKHFQDMDVPQFHNFNGSSIEGMSLKMEIGKIIEGTFSVMAFGVDTDTAQILGATTPAVSDTSPMNAVTNVQNFNVDGVPYMGCISKLDMDIKNNIRAIKCLGSLQARDMKLGTLEVTGSMEFYFNDSSNFDKFVAGTEFSFDFDLIDEDGNQYNIAIPRAKFETGEVVAGGKNSDVMFNAKWRGLYDSVTDRVILITETPAP